MKKAFSAIIGDAVGIGSATNGYLLKMVDLSNKLIGNSIVYETINGIGIGKLNVLTKLDINGNIAIYNEIMEVFTNATAAIYINNVGYNGGVTQFRDLHIRDGKGSDILIIQGSTKRIQIEGPQLYLQNSSNDLLIGFSANKTLVFGQPVYNDLYIPLAGAKVPASHAPTWSTFSANLNSYTFAVDDYADLATTEILHGYSEGTDLNLHIHIITNGTEAIATKAQYTLYYSIGNVNATMSAEASNTFELTIPANTPDRTHLYLDMGDITGTNITLGASLKLRIKRVAKSAGGSNPAADPFVEMVGVHYQIVRTGSRFETTV